MEATLESAQERTGLITPEDTRLFKAGRHTRLYEKLGSHIIHAGGAAGTNFAVWAPHCRQVSVIGDFNGWDRAAHILKPRSDGSGVWEGFIPDVRQGALYKYHIVSAVNNYQADKRDPFSFHCEVPPSRASVVWDLSYAWKDGQWMRRRLLKNNRRSPLSIYEMHFGSWRRDPKNPHRFISYDEMALDLIRYLKDMAFTHVEFLPLTAHPLYESWGYQTDGYFAPTSRYGTPQQLMALIDLLHQNGIGVILDWVPSHFPTDRHGLAYFDGTHLFEHADPRQGFHPEWKSSIFNYGRHEVKDFLISSALFWLDQYHIDGLRVDGGSSMLYLDYARKRGEWVPNKYGGRENLEAVDFLRQLNETIRAKYPDTQIMVEEATSWPKVSRPVADDGLGFGMKWDMGWMHDTLKYFALDPSRRQHGHNHLTFSIWYFYSENFLLPLSHDEVVHGKGSLIRKMPGDDWQKFANLRLLFAYMFGHPGKKLIFMGGEIGQWAEWNPHKSIDWHLLEHSRHEGLRRLVRDLNRVYRDHPALYENDFMPEGFEWVDLNDARQSVICFLRKGRTADDTVFVVGNFTPVTRPHYRVGIPADGYWQEILNSDAQEYGGAGVGNYGGVTAQPFPWHGRPFSLSLTLPPLAVLFFRRKKEEIHA
ncbi:MAG: 1,4-alpha-glucan branching protein GlgB [Candidatus Omnitrophica bacterium]|nr:1,4-alpha-glucan branching protein GlgB [Candidatus Omnitrophota bacterium]